ncbi:MAG: 4-hydroxy-tetrahydrodipicolinate reductase, partial [Dehalococcoidia bacterium]|nr:4-hydroxy-tetrahydrodipicolinate reductase [Dehalococcoidia bacterium]
MASTRVVVNGAAGRMGREVIAALCREPDMEPVGGVDIKAGNSLDLPDGSGIIPLSSDLGEILSTTKPHVLVDFTQAEVTMASAPVAASHGVNMVIGTTGISDDNLQELDRISREHSIGIFVAPNFALGAVLLMHLAKQAAPFFEYVDIIEMHHEAKIDAPSGTALAMAKA